MGGCQMVIRAALRNCGIAALLAGTLAGCVTVDIQDKRRGELNNPTASSRRSDFETSMSYLQKARRALISRTKIMETFDAATRLGVGVGVVGAGISAAGKNRAAARAGKWLTGGAVSYIANKDVAPLAIAQVYRAGLSNLDCIRTAAVDAHDRIALMQEDLDMARRDGVIQEVRSATRKLLDDIKKIEDLAPDEKAASLTTSVEPALHAVASAEAAVTNMRLFAMRVNGDTIVGEKVLTAVNGTLEIVNIQALDRTPDVDAILQSGSAFGTFLKAGAGWASQISDAKTALDKALTNANAGSQAGGKLKAAKLQEDFIRDQLALKAVLAKIPDLSVEGDLDDISACRVVLGAVAPVNVTPNPVVIVAGGEAVALAITGRKTFVAKNLPADVTFDPYGNKPTLKASDAARAGDYTFHVVDGNGIDSGEVKLTITAKAKTAADTAGNDKQADGAAGGSKPADDVPAPAAGGPPPTPGTGAGTGENAGTGTGDKGGA